MARIKLGSEETPRRIDRTLLDLLVGELQSNRDSGQPFIYEQTYSTGKIKILVVWDRWNDLPLEERTNLILAAIEKSDGRDYRDKIALASGLTVPEAVGAGMLPYQIIAARRKSDSVTEKQCYKAMLDEGASELFGPNVQLRFPTKEAAEASQQRLIKKLPASEDIWLVTCEITAQDFGEAHSTAVVEPA